MSSSLISVDILRVTPYLKRRRRRGGGEEKEEKENVWRYNGWEFPFREDKDGQVWEDHWLSRLKTKKITLMQVIVEVLKTIDEKIMRAAREKWNITGMVAVI